MKFISSLAALSLTSVKAFKKAPGNGPCRGPGGVGDKVNNRGAYEIDEDECKVFCEAEPDCNGFTHSPAINEGECVLHGPGLAGTCSDGQYDLRSTCAGAGKEWTQPEAPWKGESWHSTIVAGTTEETSSSYSCYELDDDDHLAQCTGDSCAFSSVDRLLQNCPDGCVFTPAPEMPPEKPPHPGDVELAGWGKPISGACRGGPDGTDKVNGIYATKDTQSQTQCAEKCLELAPDCTGYHHGPYCSIFGPDIDKAADDIVWFANAANETIITGTKANDQYICFLSVPPTKAVDDINGRSGSSVLTLHLGMSMVFIGALISL